MQIIFPKEISNQTIENKKDCEGVVVIGANGSGKTRFGHKVHRINSGSLFITSQKSLRIPTQITLKSKEEAEREFYTGGVQKSRSSFGNRNSLEPIDSLWDFEQLLILLFVEEASISTQYRKQKLTDDAVEIPKTKLDIVQEIWEKIITHKKLFLEEFKIAVADYSGAEMSDGERLIFYIIGQITCAKENQLIIIDEPENHLHQAVVKKLYDQLEKIRPDCTFFYLTHDIDFAFSRNKYCKIWSQSYEGEDVWKYKFIAKDTPIPEQLYLEVLGSRKDILFIEGENSSIDYSLYTLVFDDMTVKPANSCENVIQIVKSFNSEKGFHNIQSFGLIDRDRRNDDQVRYLNDRDIWILDVAEAENLLLIENIVKTISSHMGKNAVEVFNAVKENLVNYFEKVLDDQVLLHLKEKIRREYIKASNFSSKQIDDVVNEVDNLIEQIDIKDEFENLKEEFQGYLEDKNYQAILKVFNLKNALVPESKVCSLCGISSREEYLELVITLLKLDGEKSDVIKTAIKDHISKNAT